MMLAFNSFFFVIITYLYIIVNLVITYGVEMKYLFFLFLITLSFPLTAGSSKT